MSKKVKIVKYVNDGDFFTPKLKEKFAIGSVHEVTGGWEYFGDFMVELDGVDALGWREDELEVAFISVNSKTKNLGRFKNKDDAIKARRDAEIKYKYHNNHGKDMS